jgi:hypothetical protein
MARIARSVYLSRIERDGSSCMAAPRPGHVLQSRVCELFMLPPRLDPGRSICNVGTDVDARGCMHAQRSRPTTRWISSERLLADLGLGTIASLHDRSSPRSESVGAQRRSLSGQMTLQAAQCWGASGAGSRV